MQPAELVKRVGWLQQAFKLSQSPGISAGALHYHQRHFPTAASSGSNTPANDTQKQQTDTGSSESKAPTKLDEQVKMLWKEVDDLKKHKNKKDPSEELRQLRGYRDTDDRLLEEYVTKAVADALTDATVIHGSRYLFKGRDADLDGLVVGRHLGKDVVVFCEAKHNMDSSYGHAKNAVFETLTYWEKLASSTLAADGDLDDDMRLDYIELQVAEHKDKKVMFAFGGAKFSLTVADKRFGRLATPWFYVVANPKGMYCAKPWPLPLSLPRTQQQQQHPHQEQDGPSNTA